jgi:hypothetical protein
MAAATWPAFMKPSDESVNQAGLQQLKDFHRSSSAGYEQSHPLDIMFTGSSLAADAVMLNNNYMKAIFGGEEAAKDSIQMAYAHSLRAMAEAGIESDSLLERMNPLAYVPVGEATKDSLLETFANGRDFFAGAVDSDAERALKTRPTHRMIATTFYNKKLNSAGQSIRYNHVRGQNDMLERPQKLENFRPFENLSSKTFAPDESGGEVPLNFAAVHDHDPREAQVPRAGAPPAMVQVPELADQGAYVGSDVDVYQSLPATGGLEMLFQQSVERM